MTRHQIRMALPVSLDILDPLWCSWLAGFIDGEGCFLLRQCSDHKYGHFIIEFRLQLRADDLEILNEIKANLNCGRVRLHQSKSHPMNWNPAYVYILNRIEQIINVLIPILDKYPLRAKKLRDYLIWREAAFIIYEKGHLNGPNDRLLQLVYQLHQIKQYTEHQQAS